MVEERQDRASPLDLLGGAFWKLIAKAILDGVMVVLPSRHTMDTDTQFWLTWWVRLAGTVATLCSR